MSARASDVRELSCSECGGRFRVRAREGRQLPSEVRCPDCDAPIDVDEEGGDDFWVSRSHAEIFHRKPKPDPTDAGTSEEGEDERADDDPQGRGVERTSRRFRDVSEARREAGIDGGSPASESSDETAFEDRELVRETGAAEEAFEEARDESASEVAAEEVAKEDERESDGTDLDVGSGLELVSRDGGRDFDGTPLPKPVDRPADDSTPATDSDEATSTSPESMSGAGIVDDGSETGEARGERAESFQSTLESTDAERGETVPAEELATTPFADWEEDLEAAAREGERYDVRVHDTVERDVGVRRLVEILKEGVWSEALEVRDDGEWVPLREHEVVDTIGDYLVGQSRQILLDQEHTVPEGRAESARSRESDASAEGSGEPIRYEATGSRARWWVAFGALGLVVGVFGLAYWVRETTQTVGGTDPASAPAEDAGVDSAPDGGTDASSGATRGMDRGNSPDGAGERVASAVARASRRLHGGLEPARLAEVALRHEAWSGARHWSAIALADGDDVEDQRETFREAIRRDPSLVPDTLTLRSDVEVDAIHALGGGWSVSFRMTRGGRSVYAFKPAQKRWERGWRAELAAYRLCEMLVCGFEVPRNRPVRIRRATFEKLYDNVEGERQEEYRKRFDDLVWRTEEGPDGQTHDYLYGTLKDWVPDYAEWPIEYESVWRPWLDVDGDPSALDQPLSRALEPLKGRGDGDFYESIMAHSGGATTRRVARELSSLLVFDFLTTNWDRFSTAEEYYGVNNQFADGHFVSIDNGACFPPQTFDVVTRRLEPVGRFSSVLVASIRALEPSVVNPVLFPNPDWRERKKLGVFWRQRDRLLQRVRRLRARHGDRRVFAFR